MASRRKNSRAIKKKRKDLLAIVLITILLLFLMIVTGFYFTKKKNSETNLETGCLESGINLQNIVLFDKSDALNDVQKLAVRKELESRITSSATNTLFSVYVLNATKSHVPERILHACVPKTGKDANKFTENQRLIEKNWQQKFLRPFNSAVTSLLSDNPSETSPIMEAIQQLSFLESIGDSPHQQKLIIVSDMLQNTDALNQYRGVIDFGNFQDSSYYSSIRSKLNGLKVDILYVGRAGRENLQTNSHGIFWELYFDDQNASLNMIERITGE